ncbi:unnamed protein product [Calypogeia fissa]
MAKLGTACCTPAPSYEYKEKGNEERFAGTEVYITRPDSSEATSAVILISDVHGWKAPQLRKIGDAVAAAGLVALVPDFFQGDSFVPNPDGSCFPEVDYWLERHLPINSVGTLQRILEVLESKGIMSYGISGYCWGAKLAIEVEKVGHSDA